MVTVNLEHLAGRRVLSLSGKKVGHIEEIRAERDGDDLLVTEFHVGIFAAFERLSALAIGSAVLDLFHLRHRDCLYRIPWDKLDISDPTRPRLRCSLEQLSHMKVGMEGKSEASPPDRWRNASMNTVWKFALAVFLCAGVAGAALWYMTAARPPFSDQDQQFDGAGDVANGEQVFNAGDCSSCHATPGQPDRLRLGGGMALASPFGTFRPPNISPNPVDGIGAWSVTDLANALIGGVSPGRKHYYPAFPYTSFTSMTAADVRDLYAYLKTLPKVAGRAPPHSPAILFSIRRSVGIWKLLFFSQGRTAAHLDGDPVHDRGAYLVETVSHCAECHSTRNAMGAIKPDTRFAGGIDPQGTGFVPNITQDRLGEWTENDIATMLKTGETPNHGRVGSSMADVVTNTTMLLDGDRQAIARYIKALAPVATPHP
ncbi:c-type cytochrome [Mesorhizobium norvegicum]|uniref:cytochrome c n=2 Tax=Mesorhizobium TaxID=68287 RepID=UPI003CCC4A33